MKVFIHMGNSLLESAKLPESEIQDIVDRFNNQGFVPGLDLSILTGYSFITSNSGSGIVYITPSKDIYVTIFCSMSDRGNVVLDAGCQSTKHEKTLTTQFVGKNYIQSLEDLNNKVVQWMEKNYIRLIGHR